MRRSRLPHLASCVLLYVASAIDNGIGVTPPRGWRSWNQFDTNIRQNLIEAQYAALASRSRHVDGVPTSLLDLGYSSAGIDDGWQKCNSGPGGVGFHDAKGRPIVDTAKFPNMSAMTANARSLGITPGWYVNNCMCKETRPACALVNSTDSCFDGDVQATLEYGFGSVKIDSCGNQRNMTNYALLFNRSGTPVMLENCHNGNPFVPVREVGDGVSCPMNFFRASGDIRPQWGSVLSNLMTTSAFNAGLAGPGCYAYPDMLEVGVSAMPARGGLEYLTAAETRTHFAAWCIVSSPLVLSHDLTNDTTMDAVWPVITNREMLAVNDAWVGDAGVLVKQVCVCMFVVYVNRWIVHSHTHCKRPICNPASHVCMKCVYVCMSVYISPRRSFASPTVTGDSTSSAPRRRQWCGRRSFQMTASRCC